MEHSDRGDDFYRVMHFSAKRGIAITCRLSVCLSVCPSVTLVDQDHMGRKSWKLIARTIARVKLQTSNFACTFIGSIGTKAH